MTALVRLIEAWGKLNWFSQLTLVLFIGIVIFGQIYIIEALEDADWFARFFLILLLSSLWVVVYLVFSRPYKIENKKLQEKSKEQMQKNKDLNT